LEELGKGEQITVHGLKKKKKKKRAEVWRWNHLAQKMTSELWVLQKAVNFFTS
jgi:hypothetical protein